MKKIALITGGTSGIGFAIAKKIVGQFEEMWLVYRNDDSKAQESKKQLLQIHPGCQIELHKFDFANMESVFEFNKLIEKCQFEKFISHFVSCHGYSKSGLFLQKSTESLIHVINEHLVSNVCLTHQVIKGMSMNKFGRIIFTTSLSAHKINRGQTDYALSKAALETFVKSLTCEHIHRNITANALCVGFANNNLDRFLYNDLSDSLKKSAVPVDQVASMAELLCRTDMTHISGAIIKIDGGQQSKGNNEEYHSLAHHAEKYATRGKN